MAPSRPLPLCSLPGDVLLEILSHLLVDTPRILHRAAILRTCKLLHELGLPLLYQVVDMTGFQTRDKSLRDWDNLFGPSGALTKGRPSGAAVRELRLGGRYDPLPDQHWLERDNRFNRE